MPNDVSATLSKDLSYLLRSDIYHPVSQIDVPSALRSQFVALSSSDTLQSSLGHLEKLLSEGHFLIAAHLCASILTGSKVSPTEIQLIFSLFYTRLACLVLSGNTSLAAQESKALEDLSSAFYYVDTDIERSDIILDHSHRETPASHIVPWPLRVLAVRLQSIGFGDPRRGIAGLYELGLEARREITRPGQAFERGIWKERLADLGIRSVNALIEMGDLDAARRSLDSLTAPPDETKANEMRKLLLMLRIGDLDAAKRLLGSAEREDAILKPLLSMAESRYADAVAEWRALSGTGAHPNEEALILQNLAVSLIYTGQLNEVIYPGDSFPCPDSSTKMSCS